MAKQHLYLIIALGLFIFLWFQKSITEKFGGFGTAGGNCQYCHSGINKQQQALSGLNQCDVKNPQFSQFSDEAGIVQTPSYLVNGGKGPTPESESYAYSVIEKQGKQIRKLRNRLKKMALKLDDVGDKQFYRRKLSNKYYRPRPFLSHAYENSMNLRDDDFSTKTLSTIKFLSHTRSSKYHGDEIHFPSELCGHYCTTNDPNAQFHEQIDLVRPVKPTGYIRTNK